MRGTVVSHGSMKLNWIPICIFMESLAAGLQGVGKCAMGRPENSGSFTWESIVTWIGMLALGMDFLLLRDEDDV